MDEDAGTTDAASGVSEAADRAEDAAERAESSTALRTAAHTGFVASGLVHILIGWIALRLALGSGGGDADQSGALASVAQAPGGEILLGIGALAMGALAIWNALEAWFEARREPTVATKLSRAVSYGGKAVVYAVMAVAAGRFAVGAGSSSSQQTEGAAAPLLGNPAGQVLVVAVGAVIVGIGVFHVVKGATRRFERDLRREPSGSASALVVACGMAGFIAKGVALIAVGALFAWAGIGADPDKATGLDGALHTMAGLPAGTILLALVGIGLVLYGVYSFFRARYEDL